jgi:hypothetical protein
VGRWASSQVSVGGRSSGRRRRRRRSFSKSFESVEEGRAAVENWLSREGEGGGKSSNERAKGCGRSCRFPLEEGLASLAMRSRVASLRLSGLVSSPRKVIMRRDDELESKDARGKTSSVNSRSCFWLTETEVP